MMTLDTFFRDFGTLIGITGFALDAGGEAQLSIGDHVVDILGDRRDGRVLLSTLLGELPGRGRETVMARLLGANAMLAGTGGATIGVPDGSGAAILARRVAVAHETPESFADLLVAFAETADRLAGLLAPPEAPADAPSDLTMLRI